MTLRFPRIGAVLIPLLLLPAACSSRRHAPPPPVMEEEDVGRPLPLSEPLFVKGSIYRDMQQHTFSQDGEDTDPCLSPDGKWLYFASNYRSPNYQIYRKTPSGRALQQVTTGKDSHDRFPALSADGQVLAWTSDRAGNYDIWIGNPDSPERGPQQVTSSAEDELHPTWSPDGARLAYCAFSPRTGQWDIRVVDFDTAQTTILGEGFLPAWHPSRNCIAFQKPRRRGDAWYGIWTLDLAGNLLTQVVADARWAAIHPAWEPDGDYLVFASANKAPEALTREEERADDLHIVRADATGLLRLTTHPAYDGSPHWGHDGRIYFSSEINGHRNIWSVRPNLPQD